MNSYHRATTPTKSGRKRYRLLVFAFWATVIGLAAGCTQQQAQQQPQQPPQGQQQGRGGRGRGAGGPGGPAVPVLIDKVILKTVPVELTAIGNVEPYSTVSVKAQVAGPLLEAHFKQGDYVHKGQLLFKIDEEPFRADLERAQAALARDKAVAANNRTQAERYRKLLAEGVVPAQQVETFTSAADAADAVVASDLAAVKTSQLNLRYCTITAPIDGPTGSLMVQPGNLVKASDVAMVIINQINPIYVNFTIQQNYLSVLKTEMAKGRLRVVATIPDDPGPPEEGALTFVDNTVDSTTGTIRLRATFANSRNRLWPGLYVNSVLRLSEESNTMVVPVDAITASPNGQIVWVVKPDNTVEARTVVSKRTVAGSAVIDQGLQEGETVVVDGQLRLVPGTRVDFKNNPSTDKPTKNADDATGISTGPDPKQSRQEAQR